MVEREENLSSMYEASCVILISNGLHLISQDLLLLYLQYKWWSAQLLLNE